MSELADTGATQLSGGDELAHPAKCSCSQNCLGETLPLAGENQGRCRPGRGFMATFTGPAGSLVSSLRSAGFAPLRDSPMSLAVPRGVEWWAG